MVSPAVEDDDIDVDDSIDANEEEDEEGDDYIPSPELVANKNRARNRNWNHNNSTRTKRRQLQRRRPQDGKTGNGVGRNTNHHEEEHDNNHDDKDEDRPVRNRNVPSMYSEAVKHTKKKAKSRGRNNGTKQTGKTKKRKMKGTKTRTDRATTSSSSSGPSKLTGVAGHQETHNRLVTQRMARKQRFRHNFLAQNVDALRPFCTASVLQNTGTTEHHHNAHDDDHETDTEEDDDDSDNDSEEADRSHSSSSPGLEVLPALFVLNNQPPALVNTKTATLTTEQLNNLECMIRMHKQNLAMVMYARSSTTTADKHENPNHNYESTEQNGTPKNPTSATNNDGTSENELEVLKNKALQVISFLCYLKGQTGKDNNDDHGDDDNINNEIVTGPSLILCPVESSSTWCSEFDRCAPTLNYCYLRDPSSMSFTMADRISQRKILSFNHDITQYDAIITTYDIMSELQSDAMKALLFERLQFNYLILDDGNGVIKDYHGTIAHSLRLIRSENKMMLLKPPLSSSSSDSSESNTAAITQVRNTRISSCVSKIPMQYDELFTAFNFLYPDIFTTIEPFVKNIHYNNMSNTTVSQSTTAKSVKRKQNEKKRSQYTTNYETESSMKGIANEDEMSDYEKLRLAKIKRNEERMKALGLMGDFRSHNQKKDGINGNKSTDTNPEIRTNSNARRIHDDDDKRQKDNEEELNGGPGTTNATLADNDGVSNNIVTKSQVDAVKDASSVTSYAASGIISTIDKTFLVQAQKLLNLFMIRPLTPEDVDPTLLTLPKSITAEKKSIFVNFFGSTSPLMLTSSKRKAKKKKKKRKRQASSLGEDDDADDDDDNGDHDNKAKPSRKRHNTNPIKIMRICPDTARVVQYNSVNEAASRLSIARSSLAKHIFDRTTKEAKRGLPYAGFHWRLADDNDSNSQEDDRIIPKDHKRCKLCKKTFHFRGYTTHVKSCTNKLMDDYQTEDDDDRDDNDEIDDVEEKINGSAKDRTTPPKKKRKRRALLKLDATKVYCPLSKMQQFWYKELLIDDIDSLVELTTAKTAATNQQLDCVTDTQTLNKKTLRSLFDNLQKCSNHPFLFDGVEEVVTTADSDSSHELSSARRVEELIGSSGKLAVLDLLLLSLFRRNHRVVIFTQKAKLLNLLEDYCVRRKWKYVRIDGRKDINDHGRRDYLLRRYNDPNSPFFLCLVSIQQQQQQKSGARTDTGGDGTSDSIIDCNTIDIHSADTCIYYDSDLKNPQSDILRATSLCDVRKKVREPPVRIYRLVGSGTVEERMLHRAEIKNSSNMDIKKEATIDNGEANDDLSIDIDERRGVSCRDLLEDIKVGCDSIFRSNNNLLSDEVADANSNSTNGNLPSINDIYSVIDRSREKINISTRIKKTKIRGESAFDNSAVHTTTKELITSPLLSSVTASSSGGIGFFNDLRNRLEEGHGKKRTSKNMKYKANLWKNTKSVDKTKRSTTSILASQNDQAKTMESHKLNNNSDNAIEKGQKKFDNEDECYICGDGGFLVCCPRCPVAVHLSCVGLKHAKDFKQCSHHRCIVCKKDHEAFGGILFPCQCCDRAYCEECLPKEGVSFCDKVDRFEKLGFTATEKIVYINCKPDCEKYARNEFGYDPKQEKKGITCPQELDFSKYFESTGIADTAKSSSPSSIADNGDVRSTSATMAASRSASTIINDDNDPTTSLTTAKAAVDANIDKIGRLPANVSSRTNSKKNSELKSFAKKKDKKKVLKTPDKRIGKGVEEKILDTDDFPLKANNQGISNRSTLKITSNKKIIKICMDTGRVLKKFNSLSAAARSISVQRSVMSLRMKNYPKLPYKSFYWRFESVSEQDLDAQPPVHPSTTKKDKPTSPKKERKIMKICMHSASVVGTFDSITAAAASVGITKLSLTRHMKNSPAHPKAEFYWRYVQESDNAISDSEETDSIPRQTLTEAESTRLAPRAKPKTSVGDSPHSAKNRIRTSSINPATNLAASSFSNDNRQNNEGTNAPALLHNVNLDTENLGVHIEKKLDPRCNSGKQIMVVTKVTNPKYVYQIRAGDILMRIDQVSVENKSMKEVFRILKNRKRPMTITFQRNDTVAIFISAPRYKDKKRRKIVHNQNQQHMQTIQGTSRLPTTFTHQPRSISARNDPQRLQFLPPPTTYSTDHPTSSMGEPGYQGDHSYRYGGTNQIRGGLNRMSDRMINEPQPPPQQQQYLEQGANLPIYHRELYQNHTENLPSHPKYQFPHASQQTTYVTSRRPIHMGGSGSNINNAIEID